MDPAQISFETLAISWLTNQIISWLKRSPWAGWITQESATVSRGLAAILTFIGTFGVVLACSGSAATGWDCRVTIPPAAQLQQFLLRWLGTLSVSHIQYEISQAGRRQREAA